MEITLDPVHGLVDEPVEFVVSGADADTEVDLTVSMTDAAGHA